MVQTIITVLPVGMGFGSGLIRMFVSHFVLLVNLLKNCLIIILTTRQNVVYVKVNAQHAWDFQQTVAHASVVVWEVKLEIS